MTTTQITPEQHLTVVKHLASGKDLDAVATITKLDRSTVLGIGSKHGYPSTDKLSWAVDVLAKKYADDQVAAIPEGTAPPSATARPHTAGVGPQPAPAAPTEEFRILINTAKSHPSKRIQAQADRVLDGVGKLKDLLRDDEAKHAERRRVEAEKEAARAEIKRLEKALAEAKAKFKSSAQRPGGVTAHKSGQLAVAREMAHSALTSEATLAPLGLNSKTLRAWAHQNNVECPTVGRVPTRVLDAWKTAHPEAASA